MRRVTPIFVFNSLNTQRGGLTKAVLTRANTLSDHFDSVHFFTLKFQRNHREIIDKLYQSNALDARVQTYNMFLDLDPFKEESAVDGAAAYGATPNERGRYAPVDVTPHGDRTASPMGVTPDTGERAVSRTTTCEGKQTTAAEITLAQLGANGIVKIEDKKAPSLSYRCYRNGLYVHYERFDENGQLAFIDYFNENRHRLRREEFNEQGDLVRIRHMDLVTNKPSLDRYFSRNGSCYLTTWLDSKTGKVGRCILLQPTTREFGSFNDLCSFWITQKVASIPHAVLMSDARDTDAIVLNVENTTVKRVAVLHNNHFDEPFTMGAPVRGRWKTLLRNFDRFERIVFLTREQLTDFQQQFGAHDNFCVIPHSVPTIAVRLHEHPHEPDDYHPHLVVTLARYVKQKRLDEAIQAFRHVVQRVPEARYEIYGFGEEEKALKQLIKKLKLEKHVRLMGFTRDAAAVYRRAACSVLTSDFEGFGLSLTESLAVGTPVVAYQSKYGPLDIVRDGVDGYLVPKGEQKLLANKIVRILRKPALREKLSRNAVAANERFSVEKYRQQWLSLIAEVAPAPETETGAKAGTEAESRVTPRMRAQ
ncbi:glycosyltransferase [Numidum massiliense]|uniref:glycosyltransferase n=1 Tax=Numidum massiliense TaxID=1522315 RepID=UPI0006D5639E|nr:glycosyltransferase [Numidum massiliense]